MFSSIERVLCVLGLVGGLFLSMAGFVSALAVVWVSYTTVVDSGIVALCVFAVIMCTIGMGAFITMLFNEVA